MTEHSAAPVYPLVGATIHGLTDVPQWWKQWCLALRIANGGWHPTTGIVAVGTVPR